MVAGVTATYRERVAADRRYPAMPEEPVKVLTVHNRYRQPGGEDLVFEEEAALLEARGHEVIRYVEDNDRIPEMGRAEIARSTFFNTSAYRELRALIRRRRPRVVHFHNTFPLVSPSSYYAAAAEGVPAVQTLHNYRLLCPNGLFFRDGHPCEDCLGKALAWPGVAHGCYRESRAATGLVAAAISAHRALGTWARKVTLYVALTDFARRKFVEGGLPADRIEVKPNFVSEDAGPGDGSGAYALFVGRLSGEKGVGTLLETWDRREMADVPLKIAGDGPLAGLVSRAARANPSIEWLGHGSAEKVRDLMKDAGLLVVPSEWYETFGRVAAESFAAGTPVVTAGVGAVGEIVGHGHTGRYFRPGDPVDLARQIRCLRSRPKHLARMRHNARAEFEEKYTAARNYRMLTKIYGSAIERVGVRL